MESIFNAAVRDKFVGRINKLTPATPALWGKMNVSQMLAHCQVPLKMALDDLQIKRGLVGILFGRIARKQILSDQPFKRNMPTFKEARITSDKDFETEKQGLTMLIKRFEAGPGVLTNKPHGFFGELTPDEWDQLQVKHLDHHLQQFSV
jgi:hypothetical protein